MTQYWFLLTKDSILSKYVTTRPSITYRRSWSLKDILVSSHFIGPETRESGKSMGIPAAVIAKLANTLMSAQKPHYRGYSLENKALCYLSDTASYLSHVLPLCRVLYWQD